MKHLPELLKKHITANPVEKTAEEKVVDALEKALSITTAEHAGCPWEVADKKEPDGDEWV